MPKPKHHLTRAAARADDQTRFSSLSSPPPPSPPPSQPPTPTHTSVHSPDLITSSARLNTFPKEWPEDWLSREEIARRGFFFKEGQGKRWGAAIVCFSCNIHRTTSLWMIGDRKHKLFNHRPGCLWQCMAKEAIQLPPSRGPLPAMASTRPLPSRIPRPSPKKQPLPTASRPSIPILSRPPSPFLSPPAPSPPAPPRPARTYASVAATPPPQPPQPSRTLQTPSSTPRPVLTIQDLYKRFHNKPSPVHRQTPAFSRTAYSITRLLSSVLSAFTRCILDVYPTLRGPASSPSLIAQRGAHRTILGYVPHQFPFQLTK